MIGCVPRGVDRVDRQLASVEPVPVEQHPARNESAVVGVQAAPAGSAPRSESVAPGLRGRRRGRTERQYLGAGGVAQPSRQGRVIEVGMGDENPPQPVSGSLEQGGQVGVVVRAGIHQYQAVVAEQVGVCARAGHKAGVRSDDSPDARCYIDEPARLQMIGPDGELGCALFGRAHAAVPEAHGWNPTQTDGRRGRRPRRPQAARLPSSSRNRTRGPVRRTARR